MSPRRPVFRLVAFALAALVLAASGALGIQASATAAAPRPAQPQTQTPVQAQTPALTPGRALGSISSTRRAATNTSLRVPAAGSPAAAQVKTGCGVLSIVCHYADHTYMGIKNKATGIYKCVKSPLQCAKNKATQVKNGFIRKGQAVKQCLHHPSAGGCFKSFAGLVPHPGLPGVPGSDCGALEPVCGQASKLASVPGVPGMSGHVPGLGAPLTSIPGMGSIADPFKSVGGIVAKGVADAWTAAMLTLWSAGLLILRVVLGFCEFFLTPDLSAGGPGKAVYGYALWGAGSLATIMTFIQLGMAAFKREGKGLARVLIGSAQFMMVCSLWFGYCVTVVAACATITSALMKGLLGVNTWSGWDPLGGLDIKHITDGGVATVLGLLGLVLWLAAIGHFLVYLARAAALLVLNASGPLSAAGLMAEAGRSWFWKSLRWFHAAAFTPVIMVFVLGVGVQMATGVSAHLASSTQKAIGTALPAVMLILIAVVTPLVLFKLLAFVEPGTPSGASFRQGLAAQGWLQGKLGGGSQGGSDTASTSDSHGRSAGESSAETSTGDRFKGAFGSLKDGLSGLATPAGAMQGLSTGLGLVSSLGAKGSSLLSDVSNQSGVGHQTYGPDFSNARPDGSGVRGGGHPAHPNDSDNDDDGDDDTPPPTTPPTPTPQTVAASAPTPKPPTPTPQGPTGSSSGKAAGGEGATAEAAAEVPPIPPM